MNVLGISAPRLLLPALLIGALITAACTSTTPAPAATSAPAPTAAPTKPAAAATAAPAAPAAPTVAKPAAQPGATQAAITLKLAHQFTPTHFITKNGVVPFMERVGELTGGKVKFEHYPAEQLGKRADMLNLTKAGVTDIGGVSVSSFVGEFPLGSLGAVPTLFNTSTQGTTAYMKMLKEGPLRDEFTRNQLVPLFYFSPAQYEVHSTKKQITKLEDIKGQKIRSLGGYQGKAVEALGAVSVQTPAQDLFLAIQRNTVDGALFAYTSAKEYKIDELVKFATVGAPFTPGFAGFSIRTEVWKTLAPETQAAMIKAGEESAARLGKYSDDENETFIKEFETRGIKVTRLPADEQARWTQALQPVIAGWDKDMAAKGLPGKEMRDAFLKAMK